MQVSSTEDYYIGLRHTHIAAGGSWLLFAKVCSVFISHVTTINYYCLSAVIGICCEIVAAGPIRDCVIWGRPTRPLMRPQVHA